MPQTIDRQQVLELTSAGAPIIDVLPPKEFSALRIAGAAGIWLREMDEAAVIGFSKSDPIIVYCHDDL